MNKRLLKHFSSLFVVLLLSACANPHVEIYPDWFSKKTVVSHADYEIIGYGEGDTLVQAKANAKEDIAQTLNSKIDSHYFSKSTDEVSKHESVLEISTNLNLQNVKVLKQEYIGKKFFVAVSYKKLDLAYKIKKALGLDSCENEVQNFYLTQTPLFQKLNSELGCKLDFELVRKDAAWQLQYKEHLFILNNAEFEQLFVTTKNRSFEFISSKNILYDKEPFYFIVKSQKKGYITLFDVYANGIVTLLETSKPLLNEISIPSKESKNYFEAGLVNEGEDTYDLFVAIFSKEPLDASRFEYADENLESNAQAYKFTELFQLMQKNEFSSILLRTKAR